MKLYRYSPIKSAHELQTAIKHVIRNSELLCQKVIKQKLAFSGGLTICSHYYEEYQYLQELQLSIGRQISVHNGLYVELFAPIKTENGTITNLRVRHPDPYRYQVGCLDFSVDDYQKFKNAKLKKSTPYLREIVRPDLTMLEF